MCRLSVVCVGTGEEDVLQGVVGGMLGSGCVRGNRICYRGTGYVRCSGGDAIDSGCVDMLQGNRIIRDARFRS